MWLKPKRQWHLLVGLLAALMPGAAQAALSDIKNVVIIYQENWSFDALFGSYPGANGRSNAGPWTTQTDLTFTAYGAATQGGQLLPVAEASVAAGSAQTVSGNASLGPAGLLPNQPFDLSLYLAPTGITSTDLPHKYYTEQLQIDGGLMDQFAAWNNDSLGLSMSYYDSTNMPEGLLAQQYTLCDNFFHGAFGGSFFNHLWLVSAQPAPLPLINGVPVVTDATGVNFYAVTGTSFVSPQTPTIGSTAGSAVDANVTRNGMDWINTSYSLFQPHPNATYYVPPFSGKNIGDILSANGVTWKWYSGGWNVANLSTPTANADLFQFHHQAFNYWAEFAPGTLSRTAHLADESQFFTDLLGTTGTSATDGGPGGLPQVCFIKPQGADNEHPNYSSLMQGQEHVAMLVQAIQSSAYWPNTLIIVTYDEHGGRWDHVAPPSNPPSPEATSDIVAYVNANPARADQWGPGSRVPAILISPYVKKGYVDHTVYETTSILAMLENRFAGGARLGTRDAAVNSLEMSITQNVQPSLTPTPAPGTGGNASRTAFGPVPARKGQPVCVYYEAPVSSSHWDIYNLAGQKAASLDFGSDTNPCWDSSNAAPGIYMIRASLVFQGGGSKTVWNKVIIQP